MLRVRFMLLGFVLLSTSAPANASDWAAKWDRFWHEVKIDRHRNNCWPAPFQKMDRESVCRVMSVQLANGWRRQNTLAAIYFDKDSQQLNEAGRRKLYSIISAAPPEFRTVYVVQSVNPVAQQRREESVRSATQELFAGTVSADIQTVRLEPRTWSAERIDAIRRAEGEAQKPPVLPSFQSTTGGGGG